MTENQNLTPEQKEKNQKYILDNINKYVLDSRGNFIHIDFIVSCENKEDEKFAFTSIHVIKKKKFNIFNDIDNFLISLN